MPARLKIIEGQKFHKLTIIEEVDRHISSNGDKKRVFLCSCECGNKKTFLLQNLMKGQIYSCGCFQKEVAKQTVLKRCVTHGVSKSVEHNTWTQMKQRCYNKNNKDYKNYGGRGITICNRWLNSFESFLKDMGHRPEGTSIDRINNDGNYEPSNCRWASPTQQVHNRRKYKTKKTDG